MNKVILALLALAPTFAFAQGGFGNLETLLDGFGKLVGAALPIVVALALLAFFWGLVKYIFAQGNEDAKADGKKIMIWGLVALFVMVTVWGLVQFIADAVGIQQAPDIDPPGVQGIN